jgi:hypothetical protein
MAYSSKIVSASGCKVCGEDEVEGLVRHQDIDFDGNVVQAARCPFKPEVDPTTIPDDITDPTPWEVDVILGLDQPQTEESKALIRDFSKPSR